MDTGVCGFVGCRLLVRGGSSQPFLEVGKIEASIARSKAVYSAIDSHAFGGLKQNGEMGVMGRESRE